jgi:anti-sigma factor RsiW
MRAKGTNGAQPPGPPDRELWRRSQAIETKLDEAQRFLDLAAFADGRLDDDDTARVAALIAHDPDAAADVAAARALAGIATTSADERVFLRAVALVDEPAGGSGPSAQVIAFPPRQRIVRPWYSAATWSGLAAAIVCAGWLGFDLGSGLSGFASVGRAPDDQSASEFLDPAPLLLRDFTDSSQI